MKEFGKKQVADALEKMGLADAAESLAVLNHLPSGVVEGLAEQLKAAQEAARTDESVELKARVELANNCVYVARIVAAETKIVRNPKTGEKITKDFPARIHIKIYASEKLEKQLADYLEL